MISFRRNASRRASAHSNVPWKAILLFVLLVAAFEAAHVLMIDDSVYAQTVPEPPERVDVPSSAPDNAQTSSPDSRSTEPDGAATAQRRKGEPRIVSIYGPNTLRAGDLANYRARLADGADKPVIYRWTMGDGTRAEGNNISHRFRRPGRYTIVATARNRKGSDTDTLVVLVTPSMRPVQLSGDAPNTEPHNVGRDDEGAPTETGRSSESVSGPDASFRGSRPIAWPEGGLTLMVVTTSDQQTAEAAALDLRRRGYRSGIYLDESGLGAPVYRVVVGQFFDEASAVRARQRLLSEKGGGAFIVHPLPIP